MTAAFAIDPDQVTTATPRTLWIELTSKCPFDCIFCTRRVRFGAGMHLDFEVYKRLIGELESPDFIGLNYSGESIYYPQLQEAIRLAVGTGASTELVTAFSTISLPVLERIVESGLDRLAVSLHTMDARQYDAIYRFGSLDLLKRRIGDFLELRSKLGITKPRLDLCFVAMSENLDQLPRVAEYARQLGVVEVSVHPDHRPASGRARLLAGALVEPAHRCVQRGAAEHGPRGPGACPKVAVNVLNPDIEPNPCLSHTPAYYAPPLPADARIYTCDQSPFESVHVLASGTVAVCEVHDEVPMGNLHQQSFGEIWHGDHTGSFGGGTRRARSKDAGRASGSSLTCRRSGVRRSSLRTE